jgi:chemotaxis response regulator CheB
VQYSRPSIDVSFESIAACFGTDALGILLSGANADGAEGMAAIKLVVDIQLHKILPLPMLATCRNRQ